LTGPPVPSRDVRASDEVEYARGGWLEILRNRRFLLLTASGTLAGAGYAVYSVAVLFLAYGITGNLLVAGVVLFIEYGVYSATFLVAPLVDRARNKRTILLVAFPIQMIAAGALAIGLGEGVLSVALLLGLVFVLSVAWDFVWAVFMVGPRIVLPKRQLFLGEGLASIVSAGTTVGGYAGGGALLYFVGPYGGASAYVVLLLAAFAFAIPLSLPVEHPPATSILATFREGWDAFRGSAGRAVRTLAAFDAIVAFFAAIPPLLITAIAYQRFPHPASAYALLVTGYALGGALAGIAAGHLNPRRSVGLVLVVATFSAAACVLALLVPTALIVPAMALLGALGATLAVRYAAKYAWVQGTFPPEMLARMTANVYLPAGFAGTVAVLLVGSLSTTVSLGWLIALTGTGLGAGGLLLLVHPVLRRLAF